MRPDQLRGALESLGMSQVKFAKLLDVQPTTVNRWLRGDRRIPGTVRVLIDCLREIEKLHQQAWIVPQTHTRIALPPVMFPATVAYSSYHHNSPKEHGTMKPRNEKTSSRVAKTASKVLRTGKATPKQAKTLAGSALTQAPNRGKGRGKK